jgi:hypothetical protein
MSFQLTKINMKWLPCPDRLLELSEIYSKNNKISQRKILKSSSSKSLERRSKISSMVVTKA